VGQKEKAGLEITRQGRYEMTMNRDLIILLIGLFVLFLIAAFGEEIMEFGLFWP
jgi:hypothetical protein